MFDLILIDIGPFFIELINRRYLSLRSSPETMILMFIGQFSQHVSDLFLINMQIKSQRPTI